jgi:hypothetical protein
MNAVRDDKYGTLPKRNKVAIWCALGPRLVGANEIAIVGQGLRARFALAKSCILKVLPVWRSILPYDSSVTDLLDAAEQVMANRTTMAKSKEVYSKGWLHSDNVSAILFDTAQENQFVTAVCYGACACLATAMYDERYNEHDIRDPTWLIEDPYQLDASESACATLARGLSRDPKSIKSKRVEFWHWYLESAVRDAALV